MKFLIIPILVLVTNQIIKFIVLYSRARNVNGNRLSWSLFWVGQFPSAHTALITSAVTLIWLQYGASSLFAFSIFVALILMYGFLEDKKRQALYEGYFVKSSDPALKQIVSDKILMDFSGHALIDLAFGIFEGIFFTLLLIHYI